MRIRQPFRPLRLLVLAGLLAGAPALVPDAAAQNAIDKVLVVVNEEAITLSEYQIRHRREVLQRRGVVEPFAGRVDRRILNDMIDDRIQVQMALRRGIRVTPAMVERALGLVAEQSGAFSPQQLLEQLAREGITADRFRLSLWEQQMVRGMVDSVVNSRVVVSDREVENYLARHRELIVSDESFEVSHLVVSLAGKSGDEEIQAERENLAHIREALLQGRSFKKSVEEFSDGPNRDKGGYLGWRTLDQLPQLFVRALRQTEVGGVSEIIQSSNGLHLLKLHNRKAGDNVVEQQLLRHILIRPGAGLNDDEAAQRAGELYARIAAGEDFEKIARAHSADTATGLEGGLLGWANPGDFSPEFERAAQQLEIEEVSKPLRTHSGYHLIQVLDRRRADISMEMAARRARQILFRRKAAEFYDDWYGAIRDAAYIEYVGVAPG